MFYKLAILLMMSSFRKFSFDLVRNTTTIWTNVTANLPPYPISGLETLDFPDHSYPFE